jgi:hypothetical protein
MKEIIIDSIKYGRNIVLVDDEDFEYLNQFKWYPHKDISNTIYVVRNTPMVNRKRKHIRMHREILGVTDPKTYVDHIDHNGLNNQKYNLRKVTPFQNSWNSTSKKGGTSIYLGVSLHRKNCWRAFIMKNGKSFYLGIHKTEEDAALAYNKAAIELHGEFASLNNIKHAV